MDRFSNTILKEFYNFLRRRHALAAYKQNFIFAAIRDKSRDFQTPSMIMRDVDCRALASRPFIWANTQQGSHFWGKIDHDWRRRDTEKRLKPLQNGQQRITI